MLDSNDTSSGQLKWRTSSYSQGQNNCVEVAFSAPGEEVWVRHSKNPDGGVLQFTSDEWKAFIAGARDGEFGA